MTVEEMNNWIADPQMNFASHTEEEVIRYLETNTTANNLETAINLYSTTAWSNKYFYSGMWISRSNIWSLELMAASWMMLPAPQRQLESLNAWETVVARFSGDTQWRTYSWASDSMFDQYVCHVTYGFKNPWHLEPSKKTINAYCN